MNNKNFDSNSDHVPLETVPHMINVVNAHELVLNTLVFMDILQTALIDSGEF